MGKRRWMPHEEQYLRDHCDDTSIHDIAKALNRSLNAVQTRKTIMILTVYSRFFKLYLATAIAPIPMASFAGQPFSSIGIAFLKSYAAICLEGCIIVLACVIFSAFATTPPAIADDTLAAATIVWNYVGELIFNMLVLVGCIKMSDRLIRELMGLG